MKVISYICFTITKVTNLFSIMQIVNHIPAPVKRNWKASLDAMKVNQSAQISLQYYNSVKAAISQHFHSISAKAFTTAKEPGGYFRVWRVK